MPAPVKRPRRHRAAAALALAFSLDAARSLAEPESEPIHFELRGPDGCNGSEDFAAHVRKRSARIRLIPGPAPRSLVVVIREAPSGTFQGSVRVSERGGRGRARQLKASSCAELVEGLSLIATVTLDPDALLAEPEAEQKPEPETQPEPRKALPPPSTPRKPEARPEPPRPSPRPAEESSRWSFGASAVALFNQAPAIAPGAAAGVALELQPGRILSPFVRVSVLHAQRRHVAEAGGAASFAFTLPTLDFCPVRLGPRAVGVRPCLYGSLGMLEAWGSATAGGETHRRLTGSGGGALWLGVRVSEVFEIVLDGRLGALAPRDRFGFDGRGFFTTPALGFSAGLGVSGGFP
jgi:hypothetical protein